MEFDDNATGEVAAMQFAGGLSIERVAALWERDTDWVEAAIRRALLESIPRRDGGTKLSRSEARQAQKLEITAERVPQAGLDFGEARLVEGANPSKGFQYEGKADSQAGDLCG